MLKLQEWELKFDASHFFEQSYCWKFEHWSNFSSNSLLNWVRNHVSIHDLCRQRLFRRKIPGRANLSKFTYSKYDTVVLRTQVWVLPVEPPSFQSSTSSLGFEAVRIQIRVLHTESLSQRFCQFEHRSIIIYSNLSTGLAFLETLLTSSKCDF